MQTPNKASQRTQRSISEAGVSASLMRDSHGKQHRRQSGTKSHAAVIAASDARAPSQSVLCRENIIFKASLSRQTSVRLKQTHETCLENDVLSAQDGLAWGLGVGCRDYGSMALCPALPPVLLPMAVTHQTCRDTCCRDAALCPLAGFVRCLHYGDDQLDL